MQIAHDKLGELLHRPYVTSITIFLDFSDCSNVYFKALTNFLLIIWPSIAFVGLREAKQYFRIRGVGDMSLLPQFLQNRIREIEELTKNNEAGELNVCFSYSSTNEITSAVKQVVSHHLHNHPENTIKHGSLGENSKPSKMGDEEEDEEVTQAELERCLQTYGSPDIDMIVRTSGEIRLSDFMLWQSSASCLVITDVLWPEFSAMHLYSAVLYYQEHYESLKVRFLFPEWAIFLKLKCWPHLPLSYAQPKGHPLDFANRSIQPKSRSFFH